MIVLGLIRRIAIFFIFGLLRKFTLDAFFAQSFWKTFRTRSGQSHRLEGTTAGLHNTHARNDALAWVAAEHDDAFTMCVPSPPLAACR